MYPTYDAIRAAAAASRYSRNWFSETNLSFWETRLLEPVFPCEAGAFFVTSDAFPGPVRTYSVRHANALGEIVSVDADHPVSGGRDFVCLPTAQDAQAWARQFAAGLRMTPPETINA